MKQTLVILLALSLASPAIAQTPQPTPAYVKARQEAACSPARRSEVSARLEVIRTIDQGGRTGQTPTPETPRTDLDNRKEVAALFAEGCFTTGRDYHNAALVYQHGEVPEHYYQTFIWARRAVDLGDTEARWLIPRAIDRYLMNTGFKQLYATNLINEGIFDPSVPMANRVWCVWPSVMRISDSQRRALGVNPLADQITRAKAMNTKPSSGTCTIEVPDPPKGLFPGFW